MEPVDDIEPVAECQLSGLRPDEFKDWAESGRDGMLVLRVRSEGE